MRTIVLIAAALACLGSSALAQKSAKPRVVYMHPADATPESEALLIPAANTMRLVQSARDGMSMATFRGRFTLSGRYLIEGQAEETSVIFWPDRKSLATLPYWRQRGGPEEMYITNGWAFAQAVAPKDRLQKLQAQTLSGIRGRVTIIADDYETSIECDDADFFARFVSVVKPPLTLASKFESQDDC
jgi:hypothetical protein